MKNVAENGGFGWFWWENHRTNWGIAAMGTMGMTTSLDISPT